MDQLFFSEVHNSNGTGRESPKPDDAPISRNLKPQFVEDLKPGDKVHSSFAVASKTLASYSPQSSRAGEMYLKLTLMDATGSIEARVWDAAEHRSKGFDVDDIVFVSGQVVDFNGLQVTINKIKRVPKKQTNLSDYQSSASKGIQALIEEMTRLRESITDRSLKDLLNMFFSDPEFVHAFTHAPAGKSIHHSYLGGLLEHTLEVAKFADLAASMYPSVTNRDLLMAGAILHDIGKIKEYDLDSLTFQLTDKGKLLGHIVMGYEMVSGAISALPGGFDAYPFGTELLHIVLSHHGKREWGSPEIPKTLNAFIIFHSDLCSARYNQFASLITGHKDPFSLWTLWDKYLERSVFIGGCNTFLSDSQEGGSQKS